MKIITAIAIMLGVLQLSAQASYTGGLLKIETVDGTITLKVGCKIHEPKITTFIEDDLIVVVLENPEEPKERKIVKVTPEMYRRRR